MHGHSSKNIPPPKVHGIKGMEISTLRPVCCMRPSVTIAARIPTPTPSQLIVCHTQKVLTRASNNTNRVTFRGRLHVQPSPISTEPAALDHVRNLGKRTLFPAREEVRIPVD
jgi:hypothetical protein